MMYKRTLFALTCGLAAATIAIPEAAATEVCGDGIDNNSDGQADEGCWPAGVTGVCEQPLSCARGGAIAPKTGNLVYRLPPDLSPKVPHGIGIPFQRVYMSKYEPGSGLPSSTDFKSPLGHRFKHNYMSWVTGTGTPILHTTTGQEVKFPFSQNLGNGTVYYPQPGYHFKTFYRDGVSDEWALETLTGTVYRYDSDGMLYEIEAPGDAGDVIITYNADGQVDRVEHETGLKYLEFEYFGSSPKLLKYVKYYTKGTSSDDLRSAVEFVYSSGKLTTVKMGDPSGTMTAVQSYSYDAGGLLTLIEDGGGIDIAGFEYVNGMAGQVARLETGDGDVGYEYSPDPMDCAGTQIFYHRDSSTSCDTDADCGTGKYCGGETDPMSADTGTCYQVRRCAVVDSPNEDLITAVSAECNGGVCPSAISVKEYDWETGANDELIEMVGEKSADNIWTSYEYNSYGMVTKMVEGDTDSDASTVPSTARATWYFYDSNFPGLVTEIRRPSELKSNPSCSSTATTDCIRTLHAYYPTLAKLYQTLQVGYTQALSGGSPSIVSEDYRTTYTRNSYGQVTEVSGPIDGYGEGHDDVEFTFHTTGSMLEGYVKEVKRKTGSSTYLTTTIHQYDHWGQPIEIERPDATFTCFEYDDYRGFLSSRREAMNGQTTCSTTDTSDLTTEYTYDTWGRLTKIEKPEGNCVHYEYDAEGRLEYIKPSDGCAPASGTNPHAMRHFYSIDGLLEKTEYTFNGSVMFRQEQTHRADRRIDKLVNPENTSNHKLFDYHEDGMIKSITHEGAIGKDEFDYDDLNRREEIRRYEDSTTFDTWELLNALQLDFLLSVTDDDSKSLTWNTDDFGRRVKQVSPDSGTTLWFYDEAGNLTRQIEADGTSGEVEHTFSFDPQYRPTDSDYEGVDCGLDQEPEIQRAYDALPAGVSCPTGAACANLEGRLAYVKTMMFCDSGEADDTFDQETFYSYDDAGRVVETYVIDDGGRTAKTSYSWNKNSKPTEINRPIASSVKWKYGGSSTDSDADQVTAVQGGGLGGSLYDIRWDPFGPVATWGQFNQRDGESIIMKADADKAYRPKRLLWEEKTSHDALFRIDWTRDEKGRVTVRDFTSGHADLQDAHYSFDDMDRILCDSAATGSCPTSGTDLKSNFSGSDPYSASGERTELTHRSLVYGTETYPYTYQTGSDQLGTVGIGTGTREVTYTFDERGNRTSEDDDGLSYDQRDFTYDGRGNLQTVRGKYKPDAMASWRYYTITYAYDERNHRIFRSFLDEDTDDESHTFFYYDLFDRLIGVKHTPDVSASSTYQLFRIDWLNHRPVHYIQIDYPGNVTSRVYLHTDELGRPLEAWSRPASGDTQRIWAINPDVFGWDDIIVGDDVFQPFRFPGQLVDHDTTAWADFEDPARPPLHDNHHRVYDPFTGMYLQTDPEIARTWSSYGYAGNDPVAKVDPTGKIWRDDFGPDGVLGDGCVVLIDGGPITVDLCFHDWFDADFGIGGLVPIFPDDGCGGGGDCDSEDPDPSVCDGFDYVFPGNVCCWLIPDQSRGAFCAYQCVDPTTNRNRPVYHPYDELHVGECIPGFDFAKFPGVDCQERFFAHECLPKGKEPAGEFQFPELSGF
jgi:RHS repeat-associated protein